MAIFRVFAALSLSGILAVQGMQIEGYAPLRHDRFASAFTTNPVVNPIANNDPQFLGASYDFSGVPWNAADRRQSFVFLSRKHYLFANHFGPGTNLQFFSHVTGLGSANRGSVVNLPDSDIGIARLTSLLPASARIRTYPLLDLPMNSYVGRDLLIYGWFARLGKSKISRVLPAGNVVNGTTKKYLFEYEGPLARTDFVTLQSLDSGSPSFVPFGGELTLTGNHFYIINAGAGGGGDSFLALPEVVSQINAVLAEDGFALKFRTEPAQQWTGSNGSNWGTLQNWSSSGPPAVPSPIQTVGFDSSITNKSISLGSDLTTRGMLFTGAVGQTGYTFQAGQTLTVGYVGIRNDAPATQTFHCSVTLDAHQHWTASNGNLQFSGAINLEARSLNLGGAQTIVLSGNIGGTGGLSIQEGITRLNATAAHTGFTYLYGGELHVLGAGQLPSGGTVIVAGGQLRVDGVHLNSGSLQVLDDSKLIFAAGSGFIAFASSVAAAWTANTTLTVEGFDKTTHQLKFGTAFEDITPTQRAAINFVGVPAFHAGNGQLRPATAIEQWTLQKFPQEAGNPLTQEALWGPDANPSGDGTPNVLKYALDLDPLSSTTAQLPQALVNPEGHLQLSIPRNPNATDVTYLVEVSGDLTTWESGDTHTVIVTDEPALLVVRDAVLSSETGRRFMRLVVGIEGSN